MTDDLDIWWCEAHGDVAYEDTTVCNGITYEHYVGEDRECVRRELALVPVRGEPATEKQIAFLAKLTGYTCAELHRKKLTKSEASQWIDKLKDSGTWNWSDHAERW